MKKLFKPYWLFLFITIPQGLFFLFSLRTFSLITPLLSPESIRIWETLGLIQVVLNAGLTIYAAVMLKKNRHIHIGIPYVMLVCYTVYLFFFFMYINRLLPFSIPGWIASNNELVIFQLMLSVPLFIYAIALLVSHFTPLEKKHVLWKNFLPVVGVPLFWYLIITIGISLIGFGADRFISYQVMEYIRGVLMITSSIVFFFFLFRIFYIILNRKTRKWNKLHLIWKIPIACIAPQIGLLLNNGAGFFSSSGHGIFGNFHHPVYYVLAMLSGIAICLPTFKNYKINFLLFITRSFCASFIFYFFLVFLPYLPFAVLAIILFGAGLLMLAPLIIMLLYTKQFNNDFRTLSAHFSKKLLAAVMAGGFLILPLTVVGSYIYQRNQLHKALDYVYESDYSKETAINPDAVANVLKEARSLKRTTRNSPFGNGKPILSTVYKWLVFDNLTLSNEKIKILELIFKGRSSHWTGRNDIRFTNEHVKVIKSTTRTRYNHEQEYFESTIDLDIKNFNKWQQEFVTSFTLPPGSFITDYYLYVGDEKKHGLLTEKGSALWVYRQITSRRRDPGILYYRNKNTVVFRVFPFARYESRRTGFTIIHKRPFTLALDGRSYSLDDKSVTVQGKITHIAGGAATYIPAALKKQLPPVTAQRPVHFIVDYSRFNNGTIGSYKMSIDHIIQKYSLDKDEITIHTTNFTSKSYPYNKWKRIATPIKNKGGFFLGHTIRKILFNAYSQKQIQPVIIVVSKNYRNALFTKELHNFEMTFPASETFYVITGLELDSYSFLKPHLVVQKNTDIQTTARVLAWPDRETPEAYLALNNKDSIVLNLDSQNTVTANSNKWETALGLYAVWLKTEINPATGKQLWKPVIHESIKQKIMTPATSFIVVENKAQEQALLRKQDQVLKAKKSLDAGNGVKQMSEPPLLLIFLGLAAILFMRRKQFSGKNKNFLL